MKYLWMLFSAVLLLLVACSTRGEQAKEAPSVQPAPPAAVPLKQGWEKEWDDTVAAARKEGKVVVFLGGSSEVRSAVSKAFFDRFGVVVDAVSGSGREQSERLLRERRAGLYLGDVYQSGVTTQMITLKPAGVLGSMEKTFILPELKDPGEIARVWWNGQLPWVDAEHKSFAFNAFPQAWAVINTTLVKPDEMKSYRDVLNPKWKGKIVSFDLTTTGPGGKLMSTVALQILSMDYWRQFARQDPVFIRDHRQLVDWIAHGKYAIGIAPETAEIARFKKEVPALMQLPPPEEGVGLTTGFGGLALIDNPAHPNAAKLFINWLLSKEGITVYTRAGDIHSRRLDVPTDFLSPEIVRLPGVKYFDTEKEEFLLKEADTYAEARVIFGLR